MLLLRRPDSGQVRFDGHELTTLDEAALRPLRPAIQPVFQDPYGSLSPRLRVWDAVAEPLRVQGRWDPRSGPDRVTELLELTGLDPRLGDRLPHELSGGQCQRVGIARALASEPRLLVLDEPVSALDLSVRAGILNLLTDLQERLGLAYLFICHDLPLVRHFAHRVAVMHHGRIVESAPAHTLYTTPAQPLYPRAAHRRPIRPDPHDHRHGVKAAFFRRRSVATSSTASGPRRLFQASGGDSVPCGQPLTACPPATTPGPCRTHPPSDRENRFRLRTMEDLTRTGGPHERPRPPRVVHHPPRNEWGRLLSENQPYAELAPWTVLGPATALVLLSVLAVSGRPGDVAGPEATPPGPFPLE